MQDGPEAVVVRVLAGKVLKYLLVKDCGGGCDVLVGVW